jgi:hypothetical protein
MAEFMAVGSSQTTSIRIVDEHTLINDCHPVKLSMTDDSRLRALDKFVGEWTTEATHPMMPGLTVHGSAYVEWLEGKRFLIHRARTDHPDFPDAISIIGYMGEDRVEKDATSTSADGKEQLRLHYFDSRGVFRDCEAGADGTSWWWERIAPGFSQRFKGTFSADNNVIDGKSQLRRDDVHWADDLAITYRRRR